MMSTITNLSLKVVNAPFKTSAKYLFQRYGPRTLSYSRFLLPTFTFFYYFTKHEWNIECATKPQSQSNPPLTQQQCQKIYENLPKDSGFKNIINRIWVLAEHIVRFFYLLLIFTPTILLYPLSKIQRTRQFWLSVFVKSIQRAGVVWIKAFQYMSHRRDIIGEDVADRCSHLRQNAPTHDFETTKKVIKQLYGKEINEMFEEFNQVPIASGSVSQVYKAKYKGKKIALKIRHPGVEKHIHRDINLLWSISQFLAIFSRKFSLPVSEQAMKKTLMDQMDFINEADNLNTFNYMFKEREQIKFPFPFRNDTKEAVLIETFVQGVPITHYENNPHELNSAMARIGARAFFQMLMKNNFVHADCHGGNILVEIQEKKSNIFFKIWESLTEAYYQLEQKIVFSTLTSEKMRFLYKIDRKEESDMRKLLRTSKEKVVLNIIDAGMVLELGQQDRESFVNFVKSVIQCDGKMCAEMIYNLSTIDGVKIPQGKHRQYYRQLRQLFGVLDGKTIQILEGMTLLRGMLEIVRSHKMKLQGEFATILTNVIVMQAIAKSIDPKIELLKCAIPYFNYAEKISFDSKPLIDEF